MKRCRHTAQKHRGRFSGGDGWAVEDIWVNIPARGDPQSQRDVPSYSQLLHSQSRTTDVVLTRHVCANVSGGWHYKMFAKDRPIDKMSEVQFQHILQRTARSAEHLEHKPKWRQGGSAKASVLLILTDMCSVGKHEPLQELWKLRENCFLHSLCNVPSHWVRSIANDECNAQMKKITLLF